MKVINLTSWAGRNFDLAAGVLIDVPDSIATARMARGLMREPSSDELATLELQPFPAADAERTLALVPEATPLARRARKGSRR